MAAGSPCTALSPLYRPRLRTITCALGAASLLAAVLANARADEPIRGGLFITVPNPITENAVQKIKQRVQEAVQRQGRKLRVVVFDFNPHGKPAGTSNIFACMDLKEYISELRLHQIPKYPDLQTIALVQEEVTDHTVLPVLACHEIVMSSKGKLGDILRHADKTLTDVGKKAYEDAVKAWPIPNLFSRLTEGPMFEVKEAMKVGLCKIRLESRTDVKAEYKLPALSLREDSLEGRTPVVWRIEVHGALDAGKLNSLERRINAAIGKNANTIILHLDCDGGETIDAAVMAEKLRALTDFGGVMPVRTIAYVPPGRSLGAATFLAVGCSEIAMASDAKLGGFDYLKNADAEEVKVKQKMLVELASAQGYDSQPFEAMLDPKAGFPSLDAKTAQQLGIAQFSDVTGPERLYDCYGFDATQVQTSRDDWLDAVASFFREPIVNVILIMVGIAGLILELKIPGFGIPGIVSALCFVLFFWAHAFAGKSTLEFTLLAILLFILGLVLIAIEIFLLPGFGVTGISGIVLIVVSLALVMLEQMPSTSKEWGKLGTALTTVGIGLVAGLAVALVVARYLPNIPYANRLMLEPPPELENPADMGQTQEGLQASAILGAVGVATTTLRPAGKAQFGEQFLDVTAENDFVNAGARVQVIDVEGNRIVVKEVS